MTKFDIFVVNLKRSADRREAMREKIKRIRGFAKIYIDDEMVVDSTHPLAPSAREEESNLNAQGAESSENSPSLAEGARGWVETPSLRANSQNLVNLNLCEAPKNSPASWCKKSESKGAEVPPADFLLESDKRGTPPKSEKRQLLARRGSGAGGAALLQKETSESSAKSVDCFGDESPRNDKSNADCYESTNADSCNDGVVKSSQDEFAEFALHFHFFPATDATKFKNGESPLPPQYSSKLTRFVKGKDLSFGEIAIFSSSYRLWQKCVELDSPIIVLEDDIDFMQDFCQIVDIFKSPFEYVRLRYTIDKKITHLYDRFYISFDRIAGAQGYYLTPQAAQKFIKNARFWLFCVDDYMDMFFIHSVKNIIFKPFIINEDSLSAGTSTILGREKPQMRFYQKLTRELSRIYFFVIRKYMYFALSFLQNLGVELRAFFRTHKVAH